MERRLGKPYEGMEKTILGMRTGHDCLNDPEVSRHFGSRDIAQTKQEYRRAVAQFHGKVSLLAANLWRAGHDGEGKVEVVNTGNTSGGKPWLIAKRTEGGNAATIALYPAREHANAFAATLPEVRYGGPAELFPGAVGTLRYQVDLAKKTMTISYMQGNFKTGVIRGTFGKKADGAKRPRWEFGNHEFVPRSLATAYGGWQKRLLEHAFETAKNEGISEISFEHDWVSGGTGKETGNKLAQFEKEAKSRGYEVGENSYGTGLLAKKTGPQKRK